MTPVQAQIINGEVGITRQQLLTSFPEMEGNPRLNSIMDSLRGRLQNQIGRLLRGSSSIPKIVQTPLHPLVGKCAEHLLDARTNEICLMRELVEMGNTNLQNTKTSMKIVEKGTQMLRELMYDLKWELKQRAQAAQEGFNLSLGQELLMELKRTAPSGTTTTDNEEAATPPIPEDTKATQTCPVHGEVIEIITPEKERTMETDDIEFIGRIRGILRQTIPAPTTNPVPQAAAPEAAEATETPVASKEDIPPATTPEKEKRRDTKI